MNSMIQCTVGNHFKGSDSVVECRSCRRTHLGEEWWMMTLRRCLCVMVKENVILPLGMLKRVGMAGTFRRGYEWKNTKSQAISAACHRMTGALVCMCDSSTDVEACE